MINVIGCTAEENWMPSLFTVGLTNTGTFPSLSQVLKGKDRDGRPGERTYQQWIKKKIRERQAS